MNESARDLLREYAPDFPLRHGGRLVHDTSEFMSIDYGDVIVLGEQYYLVLRNESERRFGMEEPKYWVKRCKELKTGERKLLKLVFHETFPLNIGNFAIRCHRSPEKEARILDLVRGDCRFMQGVPMFDAVGNSVRVLDVIRGKRLDILVEDIQADHETYFFQFFPDILEKFIGACEAIAFLHSRGEKHGDIRRDHLWVEYGGDMYRWIDFDYAFDFHENPWGLDMFGLGNILLFLTGKAEHTHLTLAENPSTRASLDVVTSDDFLLMWPNRLANLRVIFPYIPEELNNVLMHYAAGSYVFYETVSELLDDLRPCLRLIR